MFIGIYLRNFLNALVIIFIACFFYLSYQFFFVTDMLAPIGFVPFNLFIVDNSVKAPRTILLWNKLFMDARWSLPANTLGPEFFEALRCNVINCVVTNDKYYLSSIDGFDAIMFHVGTEPLDGYSRPKTRNPAQRYVFSMLEPPSIDTCNDLSKEDKFFNWTMTYRLDSDIPWPYVSIEDIETGILVAPGSQPLWRKPPQEYTDEKLERIVYGKRKFAVWFVSFCTTPSRRENFVKDLKKYVSVDVYGACGPNKCNRNNKECDTIVTRDYKFYIAFENSLCIDYVTEKLRYALSLKVIPVVLGGADYSRFAPPHSYINANDFKNAKELADYLKHLSKTPKEYMRYFWWHKYYRPTLVPSLCKLCERLNAPFQESKTQVYTDMRSWWTNNSCYRAPNITLEIDI